MNNRDCDSCTGSRRHFLVSSLSAVAAINGTVLLSACASLLTRTVTPVDGVVRLAFNQYPDLAKRDGYLRILPQGTTDPIYVFAKGAGQFVAVSSICTHLQCNVESKGNQLVCPCHGSTYDRDGKVLQGPAMQPLQQFRTDATSDSVIVHLRSAPAHI